MRIAISFLDKTGTKTTRRLSEVGAAALPFFALLSSITLLLSITLLSSISAGLQCLPCFSNY